MPPLPELLEIGGVAFPYPPRSDSVTVKFPRARTEVTTVNGVRVTRTAANVKGGVLTIDAADTFVFPASVKDFLEALALSGAAFILRETYTKPTEVRAWLGAEFADEDGPQFKVMVRNGTLLYALKNALTINVGVPQ